MCKRFQGTSLPKQYRFGKIAPMRTAYRAPNITPKQVCNYFGHQPSVKTVYLWKRHGLLNGLGERVKLRFWYEGGRIHTTEEEIMRFKEAVRAGRE